ncbi:MAG: hypothetical protein EB150_03265 [Nitrososphaeria archaeon]|nr:hypothetical protein [Nitrososphaeria archaeon]NDB50875.1 hypothetical protein [Nitrosopumilaceae archaeon]NDB88128.1 hypothetical protein [Nitrososphaerota archaeon]NDB46412.1 hypothetical protein [Nitrososphaeria archaeon]NDB89867.1 hypothetical protein [Nitrososphaerota archaeon]
MWVLMLAGGGILVTMVSKITISGYGDEMDFFIASVIKAIIALVFVVFWIVILSKLKNKIFQKQLKP